MNNESPLKLIYISFGCPKANLEPQKMTQPPRYMLQIQYKGYCNVVGFVSSVKHTVEFELGTTNSECYTLTHCATLPKTDFQEC